jgi:quinolinate synthase
MDISAQIMQMKKEKEATIIAHYYQPLEVQKCADYIGDSLGLARIARDQVKTQNLIFAGVTFMGETAAILNPSKKIYIPDPKAGCPLANYLPGEAIKKYKKQYPGCPVVVYVNTTAETKAEADSCCTSSNAIQVINAVAKKFQMNTILFGPDKNLAHYVRQRTNLEIIAIPSNGCCPRHNLLTLQQLQKMQTLHPNARTIVHPECIAEVQSHADYIGSTAGMLNYVKTHPDQEEFIIGTEIGLTEHMRWKLPQHTYYPADPRMVCKNMKRNTPEKVLNLLKILGNEELEAPYRITVNADLAQQALRPIDAMMDLQI